MNFDAAMNLVLEEHSRAVSANKTFASSWEGYAVLEEEFEELKAEVFRKPESRDMGRVRKELVQVAAMGVRYVVDVCGLTVGVAAQEISGYVLHMPDKRRRLNSFHEGYGLLKDAVNDLWDAVRGPRYGGLGVMGRYAIEVAARAVDMLMDLCADS